jgi:hypothetical protein
LLHELLCCTSDSYNSVLDTDTGTGPIPSITVSGVNAYSGGVLARAQPWWRLPSPLLATPAECPASELQWRRRTQRQLHSKPVFCCRQKGQCAPALLFCAFLCRPFCLPPQSPVGMRSPSMSKGLGFYTRLGQHHCVIRRIQKDCMAASKWSPTPPSDHDIFI